MNAFTKLLSGFSLTCSLSLFAALPTATVTPPGLPTGLCPNKYYECDDLARDRWLLFQSSEGIAGEHHQYLLVGACSRNGVSKPVVFALLGLLGDSDQLYFDIKISFHDDLSAFKNTSASKLQSIFPEIKRHRNMMNRSSAYAYIDYASNSPVRHWIRFNATENKFILVSYFGYLNTLLCEFS